MHPASRRLPRPRDLARLMPSRPQWPTKETRLRRAADIGDLRLLAEKRAPRLVFDYVDGGAESERSLRASVQAFDELVFRPRILRDVGHVSMAPRILGREVAMPLVLGPTGFTRMMHRDGEAGVASAAASAGVPYVLSTMGTTTASDVAAAAPGGWNWFQLYVVRERARSAASLERAREAGMDVLVLTVDVPVAGARLRDVRHGMTIPPRLRWGTIGQGIARPAWTWDHLTGAPLSFSTAGGTPDDLAGMINTMFDPTVTLTDLEWLRGEWDGKILVKGVQDVEDAAALASIGVDGIVVSNHGGRQLDRAPVPLGLIPSVRDAVGHDLDVFLDGGVRSGADIAGAVALGATAVFVGRAYLYGLMAGGHAGVVRMLEIMHAELQRTMQLLGAPRIEDLNRGHVTVPGEPA
ncbi:L-lactate dehydrogenase (cytochrome) [Microbacterium sp. cf046]|uniref:alpha-hydroxy acid oxidase n=1 Tax=Microbacterium sp. cf046 TaxID=1761803 RepID=UPI0008E66D2C|nr:alpha-hydroxy acid oxidase [Microbacterium sp. cf046]SFR92363.1 L-lactate dehydrogenase (cytochrome) [Microbacterium sp. cf046]